MSQALVTANFPLPSVVGSLDAYISAVHRIPVLSSEEEQALSRDYLEDANLAAAKKLVMSHLRFVVHVARGYSGYGLQLADLIQEGNIGLMLFFNLRKSKKRLGWMNAAEVSTVAKDLGVPEATVREMESRLSGRDIGFEAPADADDDAKPAPAAFLIDDGADPYENVADEDYADNQMQTLTDALSHLDKRSRDIIQRRWLDGDNKATLQDLADEYGVSAERIRQVEANAMKKMRGLFATA